MTKTAPEGSEPLVGSEYVVRIGAVAHGGHCVARHDGRVVFVRHALPGESARIRVTDVSSSFLRADAVEILEAAPGRVRPPCPYAGPGRCGGCDFQHAGLETQRRLKADVVAEQLHRLAGIDRDVTVEPLDADGLGWRRRIRYAVDPAGRPGLHRHRSGRIEYVDRCLLGADGVGDSPVLSRRWPGAEAVEVAVDDAGDTTVLRVAERRRQQGRGRQRPRPARPAVVDGPPELSHRVRGIDYRVSSGGFWQTHPAAAETFVDAVLAAAGLRPGESVLDLYCGAGLFTAQFTRAVGATGRVVGVEGDRTAAADARRNCPDAEIVHAPVTGATVTGPADVVVLDPPRTGAGREVVEAVAAVAGRMIVYVACDPAALARDLATAAGAGWRLSALRAFDAFPMTHHVECVAVLEPAVD